MGSLGHVRLALNWKGVVCSLAVCWGCSQQAAGSDIASELAFGERCDRGDSYSCVLHAESIRGSDPAGALQALDTACRRDFLPACHDLAEAYAEGRGSPTDETKAQGLFQIACVQRHQGACFRYAMGVGRGVGQPPNPALAQALLARHCRHEELNACLDIARELAARKGNIPRRDLERRLCRDGWSRGCFALAQISDAKAAARHRQAACAEGLAEACAGAGKRK